MALIKHVDGVDIEMTPQEEAEFLASLPGDPLLVPNAISRRQFFQQLCLSGFIDSEEAVSAVASGQVPAVFEQFIMALPQSEQFNARMILSGAMEFSRNHPFVAAIAAMQNLASEDVDNFFIAAAQL